MGLTGAERRRLDELADDLGREDPRLGRAPSGGARRGWLLGRRYHGPGKIDDHEALPLSPVAHRIAGTLAGQTLPSDVLGALVGDRGR